MNLDRACTGSDERPEFLKHKINSHFVVTVFSDKSVGEPTFPARRDFPHEVYRFFPFFFARPFAVRSSITACAAASRATGTRNGDALT